MWGWLVTSLSFKGKGKVFWQTQIHPNILFLLGRPRKRKNEDINYSDKLSRPKKQNLTKANLACIQPRTSQRHKGSSDTSRTKSDQTAKSNRTSNSRYSLRSQTTTSTVINLLPFTHGSDSLVPSDSSSDDNQYLNPMGDETPILRKRQIRGTSKSHQ
ncbi:hypothetical protein O181_065922 [Austropuccinia psidii MF-1]|uniref:Uncharacterized protein n=1 Tax=Austropuccinia psidii MF-1 TaxID=1389203 RepID=A0A9Q3EUE4_9BASI|nr:hypothetical protein [Austropuccinia psidii MF-1]